MLLVISPAKTLDLTPATGAPEPTRAAFGKEAGELARIARGLSAADLRRLMGISDALATLNVERFAALKRGFARHGASAALTFAGDVYRGLDARSLHADALAWAQDRLRILSGLYGVLRPLDAIQPYRLEMGIRLANARGPTLYDFWRGAVTRALDAATRGSADRTIVNLASQEYFGVVDRDELKSPVVACTFKQEEGGALRQTALYAKVARGLMARYAIDHRVERAADLTRFDVAGYRHRPELSQPTELVFTRPHP